MFRQFRLEEESGEWIAISSDINDYMKEGWKIVDYKFYESAKVNEVNVIFHLERRKRK